MRKKKGAQEISNEVLCAEYEAVYHYALSICRNETEAQDLTQETFLKAMVLNIRKTTMEITV